MIIDHLDEIESWPEQYQRLRDLIEAGDLKNAFALQEYYMRRDELLDKPPVHLQKQN